MEKEKITSLIGSINELKKAVELINNIQDNYNKMISTDNAEEQAFLCQVCTKLLEISGEIIKEYEDNFLKLLDEINGEIDKKHNESVNDYLHDILNESTENLSIVCQYEDICISEANEYSIETNETVEWKLTDNSKGLTITNKNGNKCEVSCKNDTKLIGEKEILTATVNGKEYNKEIQIVHLI